MPDAKTVDNLGPEAHQRYINDTKILSEKEVQRVFKTPNVATRAEVLKVAPQVSEIEQLMGVSESFSSPFAPPPQETLTSSIFTFQIIPNFGPINELVEKLKSFEVKKGGKKKITKEEEKEEKQRKSLLKFAALLNILNKISSEIQNRKDEYHKG